VLPPSQNDNSHSLFSPTSTPRKPLNKQDLGQRRSPSGAGTGKHRGWRSGRRRWSARKSSGSVSRLPTAATAPSSPTNGIDPAQARPAPARPGAAASASSATPSLLDPPGYQLRVRRGIPPLPSWRQRQRSSIRFIIRARLVCPPAAMSRSAATAAEFPGHRHLAEAHQRFRDPHQHRVRARPHPDRAGVLNRGGAAVARPSPASPHAGCCCATSPQAPARVPPHPIHPARGTDKQPMRGW
jgi:hypothetical protein